jgi:hypothetical protein
MGKTAGKKKGKKKGKKGGAVGPDTSVFMENYAFACKLLGEKMEPQFEREVAGIMVSNGQLTKITFGERELNPVGMRALMEAVVGCMVPVRLDPDDVVTMTGHTYLNLSEIQIWKSNVGDDGCAAVGRMLTAVTDKTFRLSVIDLMDNNIGERGCHWLGEGLKANANATVKRLSLDHNEGIGDGGVRALCDGLSTNQTLEHLGLEFCNVGAAGARCLAQVIFTPTTALKVLRLMGNSIGRQGFINLAAGLRRNATLATLDLGDNDIGEFPPTDADRLALERVVDSLAENVTLTALNLDLNFLGSSGYGLLDVEHRERLRPALARALVFAAGMAPESVDIKEEKTGGGAKKKKKGKGKKKK